MSAAEPLPPTPPQSKLRNFLVRAATAVVLLPIILVLLWKGGWYFTGLVAVAAAISAYEFAALARLPPESRLNSALFAALFPVVLQAQARSIPLLVALVLMNAWWMQVRRPEPLAAAPARAALSLTAPLYGGLLLATLVGMRALPSGIGWVGLTFVVTWGNDTGAYFAGHAFGRHKMAPAISPGKTWEGFAGGVVASVAGAFVARATFLPVLDPQSCMLLGCVAAIAGPIGDLSESLLKRAVGAKDSGNILPGHGGILDRIDALLFVAPFIYFFAAGVSRI